MAPTEREFDETTVLEAAMELLLGAGFSSRRPVRDLRRGGWGSPGASPLQRLRRQAVVVSAGLRPLPRTNGGGNRVWPDWKSCRRLWRSGHFFDEIIERSVGRTSQRRGCMLVNAALGIGAPTTPNSSNLWREEMIFIEAFFRRAVSRRGRKNGSIAEHPFPRTKLAKLLLSVLLGQSASWRATRPPARGAGKGAANGRFWRSLAKHAKPIFRLIDSKTRDKLLRNEASYRRSLMRREAR